MKSSQTTPLTLPEMETVAVQCAGRVVSEVEHLEGGRIESVDRLNIVFDDGAELDITADWFDRVEFFPPTNTNLEVDPILLVLRPVGESEELIGI